MNKITTRNPPLLTLKNRKVFFLTRNNQKLHIVNDRLLKTNTLIKKGLRLKDSASSQAPAWELKPRSSSFLSCEARASLSGFPSWSLGTSRPVVLCRETALRLTDFSLGILCFHAITCAFAGFLVFPLDFMCFHWTSCVSAGLHVFPLDFMCFHWTSCVSTGLRVFPLDFMCFHWTSCVFEGKCVLFATHTTRHQCWVNDRAVRPTYCNLLVSM